MGRKISEKRYISRFFQVKADIGSFVEYIYPNGVPTKFIWGKKGKKKETGLKKRKAMSVTPSSNKKQMSASTTRFKHVKDISIPSRSPKKTGKSSVNFSKNFSPNFSSGRFFSSVASSKASKFFARKKKMDFKT